MIFFVYHINNFIRSKIEPVDGNFQKNETPAIDNGIEDNKINDARIAFSEGNCTLFLGAGVSASAGIPLWNNLSFTFHFIFQSFCTTFVKAVFSYYEISRPQSRFDLQEGVRRTSRSCDKFF